MSDGKSNATPGDATEPKPPTPAETMIAELGALSSHPKFLVGRLRWVRRLALAPIVIVVGYFGWRIWGRLSALPSLDPSAIIPSLLPLLQSIFSVAPAFIVAFACSTAFSFTGLLTLRASLAPHHAARAERPSVSWRLLALGTALAVTLCLAVAWAAQTSLLETSTRWWIVAASMVPLYAMLAVLEWSERDLGKGEDSGRLWYLARWALLAPAGLATIALTVPASGGWIASKLFGLLNSAASSFGLSGLSKLVLAVVERKIETYVTQMLGVFVALTVVMTLSFRVKALERRIASEIEQETPEGEQEQDERPGCVGRLFRLTGIPFLLGVFGFGRPKSVPNEDAALDAPGGAMPASPPSEWLASLESAAATDGLTIAIRWHEGEAPDASDGSTSPRIAGSGLAWLFNGLEPSSDQIALFDAFQHRWTEHLSAVEQAQYGADRESHADLLVEAEPNSGVEDAVAACAVFGCVARGQRVLIVVESRAAQDAAVDAMRERLQRFAFDTLYSVAPLRRDSVAEWCPPVSDPRAEPKGSAPDITVATLEDYESVFFSGAFAPAPLRAFQRSLEIVVVQDIDQQLVEDSTRNHLPFMIDKHRLVLRTENRAMQLLLTLKPLGGRPSVDRQTKAARARASTARRALALRLFGGDGGLDSTLDRRLPANEQTNRDAHLVYLRPITQPASPILEISASQDQANDVRIWIGRRLSKHHRLGMLFLGEKPQSSGQGAGAATRLVAGTSTFSSDRTRLEGCRWVLGASAFEGPSADMASRLVAQLSGATLVLVAPNAVRRQQAPAPPAPTYPVFPTPMSPGLFVTHLRSAATALTPNVPIRREDLARFGLAWDDRYWKTLAAAAAPQSVGQSWWLELDGALRDVIRRDDRVWPAVFLRTEAEFESHPVQVKQPLESSYCLVPGHDSLRVGRLPHAVDRRRFATWMTNRGLELGRSDLAYFQPIRHEGSRQGFRALDLDSSDDGTLVRAEPLSRDGGDLVIPVRKTRFNLPNDMRIGSPQALRALNAFLFSMQERSVPCEAEERIVALSSVGETGDETNRRGIIPIEFRLHIGVTILAIGGHLPTEDYEPTLRARYEGRWESSSGRSGAAMPRDAWPALSRAFSYAIGEVAPTLLRFANAYAFRPPRGQPGATVLLVEPSATQGTAIDALGTILDDTDLRNRFLAAFEQAARKGLRSPVAMRIDGDELENPSESEAELLAVLQLLRSAPKQATGEEEAAIAAEIAEIEPHDLSAALPRLVQGPRATPPVPEDANHRWRDINAAPIERWFSLGHDAIEGTPEYAILNDLSHEAANAATAAFGLHDGIDMHDAQALRNACIQLEVAADGTRIVLPHYEEMVRRSVPELTAIATRLLAVAQASGLGSARDRVGLFASYVQSIEYSLQREGGLQDGRERLGVQMPIATVHARKGDCDSVSLALVTLLRAAKVARAGLVLIEEPDGGHMMVAVECPAASGDARLRTPEGRLVLVEATAPWPLGRISPEYEGRHVRFLGFGEH
jgi:hypothetical protein